MKHTGSLFEAAQAELLKLAGAPTGPVSRGLRTAKRTALVAGTAGLGAYALGRGLQAGVRDRQKKDQADANRAAVLQGSPAPY